MLGFVGRHLFLFVILRSIFATVAILARGTGRAVAITQAISQTRFEHGGYATAISVDRPDISEIQNVIPLSWFVWNYRNY